jgi:hypothetical protein
MTRDPIVEEVRAARDAIAKDHGYDLEAIFAALREMEKRSGKEHVTLPPRRVTVGPTA